VGKALIAVGILDIGLMIYCIIYRISYSSSLNIFAVIGGIFLLRGSFRAASYIRRFTIFLLSFGLSALVLGMPILFPISLIITKFRLQPSFLVINAMEFLFIIFSFWLILELGNEAVLREISFTKVRKISTIFLAFSGGTLGVVLVLSFALLLHGTDATRRKQLRVRNWAQAISTPLHPSI
jgi:hypothetical protein